MTTNERIANLISKQAMTKGQIANTLGITEKTVRNRLGEIHADCHYYGERDFVVFEGKGPRRYRLMSTTPSRKTVSGTRFNRVETTDRIEGGIYDTTVYRTA